MREDCRHPESRTYPGGEAARFCVLDLAPEAPWRCPENCPAYERSVIDPTFETVELSRPPLENEPEGSIDDIEAVLADAEAIVEESEPEQSEPLTKATAARGSDRGGGSGDAAVMTGTTSGSATAEAGWLSGRASGRSGGLVRDRRGHRTVRGRDGADARFELDEACDIAW